jgi:hypothetical protein
MSAGSWAFLCGTGSLFGVAIPGTIFNVRFAQLLPTISSPEANGQAYYRASATFTKKFGDQAKDEIINVFTQSLKSVWIVFAILAGVGFALTWFEKEHRMRKELNTAYGLKPLKGSNTTSNATTAVPSPAFSAPNSGCTTPAVEEQDPMEMAERGENGV